LPAGKGAVTEELAERLMHAAPDGPVRRFHTAINRSYYFAHNSAMSLYYHTKIVMEGREIHNRMSVGRPGIVDDYPP